MEALSTGSRRRSYRVAGLRGRGEVESKPRPVGRAPRRGGPRAAEPQLQTPVLPSMRHFKDRPPVTGPHFAEPTPLKKIVHGSFGTFATDPLVPRMVPRSRKPLGQLTSKPVTGDPSVMVTVSVPPRAGGALD